MNATRTLRSDWKTHLALACFLGAVGAAAWQLPKPAHPVLAMPASDTHDLPPLMLASAPADASDTARQPSLAELPDGRIAMAWMAGPDKHPERDAIWFSRLGRQGWDAPRAIANLESAAGDSFAHIRRVDRPMLQADARGLSLYFLSGGLGMAPVNLLNRQFSADGGEQWKRARWLQSSAAGIGRIDLASPPLPLTDGGQLLMLGNAQPGGSASWLRLDARGRIIDKLRLPGTSAGSAPVAAALGPTRLWAIVPQPEAEPPQLMQSDDGGLHWQVTQKSLPALAARQSPALLRLHDGRLLLAGNPASGPGQLNLWLGDPEAERWTLVKTLESAPDGAASFIDPSLLQGRDGRLHLAYAARGRQIRYLTFTLPGLTGAGT